MHIIDERPGLSSARYSFEEEETRIYLACEDGAAIPEVTRQLEIRKSADEVRTFLDTLVAQRLVYEEDGRYLSLALPAIPRSEP